MVPVLFDLDGVLADNIPFEEAVTDYIIHRLAHARHMTVERATTVWLEILNSHRHHPWWHDYGLHCRALGLGDVWKNAHIRAKHALKTFVGVDAALHQARTIGPCWIASDATLWVVRFKLRVLGIADHFEELFTVDRCENHKGSLSYWRALLRALPSEKSPLIFIDNRYDRIASALRVLPMCLAILVEAPDHPSKMGFSQTSVSHHRHPVMRATHSGLARILAEVRQLLLNRG